MNYLFLFVALPFHFMEWICKHEHKQTQRQHPHLPNQYNPEHKTKLPQKNQMTREVQRICDAESAEEKSAAPVPPAKCTIEKKIHIINI
jgi:hypothetical protein